MPVNRSIVGATTKIYHEQLVNIYDCQIGENCKIGTFVEIQSGVKIGDNCKISSHSFICEGVTIGSNVFLGHGVLFINDRVPRAASSAGVLLEKGSWTLEETFIGDGVSIGSGAIIMCGITLGENSIIGAGAVVTKSVKRDTTVVGVPARLLR